MENTFFQLSSKQQGLFQLKLAALFIVFNIFVGGILFFLGIPFLIFFVVAFSISVFAPFVDVPGGVKAGNLMYYSPLLIGEKIRNHCLVLHSGSLFDYYFVLNKEHSAIERKKQVFSAYVDGLLNLIEQFENKQSTNISIKATSYILNPRTANKIGLKQVETDIIQRFILYFNIINLTCALSFLNKKFTWANMQNIYTYQGELDSLIAHKGKLKALKKRF